MYAWMRRRLMRPFGGSGAAPVTPTRFGTWSDPTRSAEWSDPTRAAEWSDPTRSGTWSDS